MTNLATRIETASPDEAEALFKELWHLTYGMTPAASIYDCGIFGTRPGFDERMKAEAFLKILDAKAYLSAAEMMVPEGWIISCLRDAEDADETGFLCRIETADFDAVTWGKGENWITDIVSGKDAYAWASTRALALAAAIAKAMGERAR